MSLGAGALKLVEPGNTLAQEVSMATLQVTTTGHRPACEQARHCHSDLPVECLRTNTYWTQMKRVKGVLGER